MTYVFQSLATQSLLAPEEGYYQARVHARARALTHKHTAAIAATAEPRSPSPRLCVRSLITRGGPRCGYAVAARRLLAYAGAAPASRSVFLSSSA